MSVIKKVITKSFQFILLSPLPESESGIIVPVLGMFNIISILFYDCKGTNNI